MLLELEAPDGRSSRNISDTQEVLNYLTALNHGFERLREIPVYLRLFQELHEVLMKGVRGDAERPGEFRTVQNFIGSSQDIRQARFVPPPVVEMRRCLDELEKYMNQADDALPHLVRIALVHYQFETIHPFLRVSQTGDYESNVRKLVEAGILREVTGRKRDQRFVASEIIRTAHSD